jgi:AraC family transcriptional regulator
MASSASSMLVRDAESHELRPLIHIPPTLTSQKAPWEGFKFALYLSAAYENSAYEAHSSMVVLKLGGSPLREQIWRGGRLVVQRRTYPGEIIVVPPGIYPASRTQGAMDFAVVELSSALMSRAAGDIVPSGRIELTHHWGGLNPQIEHLILALKAELEEGCPNGALYGESLAMALAVCLLKQYSYSQPSSRVYRGGLPPYRLKHIIEFIHAHLDGRLSLVEMAALAHMSVAYFIIAFKQSTGLTPHQYVLESRISQAHQLLKYTTLPLSAIAARLGFASQSHFTAVFRKHTGLTPRAYQQTCGTMAITEIEPLEAMAGADNIAYRTLPERLKIFAEAEV